MLILSTNQHHNQQIMIGYKNNLSRIFYRSKFRKQNSRIKTGFTSKTSYWNLIYSEEFPTKIDALKREIEIKVKNSRIYIEKLILG